MNEGQEDFHMWSSTTKAEEGGTTRLTLNEPTDPRLAELLEWAKSHVITDEEKRLQRESWVRGEMGLDRMEKTVLEPPQPSGGPEDDEIGICAKHVVAFSPEEYCFVCNAPNSPSPSITEQRKLPSFWELWRKWCAQQTPAFKQCDTPFNDSQHEAVEDFMNFVLREAGVRVGE